MRLVAIDFETFYETPASTPGVAPADLCSITACGQDYDAYTAHPRFDAYLVAITDGLNAPYCGPVERAPWRVLSGAVAVAHNAPFEAAVLRHLARRGLLPEDAAPAAWHCTAYDPAAPRGRRSLRAAAALHLGVEVAKDLRDGMAGRNWADLSDEEQGVMRTYCLRDATLTLRLALLGVGVRTVAPARKEPK